MNELEQALLALERVVQAKLEANPKSGVIINKGQKDEFRIRYKELLELVGSIQYQVVVRTSVARYGICKDCDHFDPTGYTKNHGRCKCPDQYSNRGKCMGIYDTCWRNTSKKEGEK